MKKLICVILAMLFVSTVAIGQVLLHRSEDGDVLTVVENYLDYENALYYWNPGITENVSITLLDNGKLEVSYHSICQPQHWISRGWGETGQPPAIHKYWKDIYCAKDGIIVFEKTLIRKTIYKTVIEEVETTKEEYIWE